MSVTSETFDFAIIGSGFAGSLLAGILAKASYRVALIDSRNHPRFSIGESSTPVADMLLEHISKEFFPRATAGPSQLSSPTVSHPIASLSRHGSWKRDFPELTCGKKRGFSYFRHHENTSFSDTADHQQAMLVTASVNDAMADTHWLRSDVDHHFHNEALKHGVTSITAFVEDAQPCQQSWNLTLRASNQSLQTLNCKFAIDAGGRSGKLHQAFGIKDASSTMRTATRATYGHYRNLGSWQQYVVSHHQHDADYPFNSDDAAQHHLLDNGWLWMLRFDNDVTSVGWTRPCDAPAERPASDDFQALGIGKYPSLRGLFAGAKLIAPQEGLVTTQRLQRLADRVVGPNFALMPTAAVTIDPLHSSGIAHGLSGVYRLASLLLQTEDDQRERAEQLMGYQRSVLAEARLLDLLVAGCYAAGGIFPLFQAHAMFYFVAAIASEETMAKSGPPATFWLADRVEFCDLVRESYERIQRLVKSQPSAAELTEHVEWTIAAIAPWNQAGLLDPAANNMYHYTAAPKTEPVA